MTLGGWLTLTAVAQVQAQTAPEPEPAPQPESLRQRKVPEPSNLKDFIKDKQAAILLGKALFWDMQVGSDNFTSCATCHFHAGADNRAKNKVSPGLLIVDADGNPTPDFTFQVRKPNARLRKEDFPFHKLSDINDRHSTIISDMNDVASSQGVTLERFIAILLAGLQEQRQVVPDPVFNVQAVNTRRGWSRATRLR